MTILPILLLFSLGIGYRVQRQRRNSRQKRALIQQLYAWAESNSTLDMDLQQWIQRLPADEAAVLVELLTGYCASLNWELEWLFAAQIERAPLLKQALEENVAAYVRAILTGLQMEEDVRAYHVYLEFARKPSARKQRTLVQKLYPSLQAQGLTVENESPAKLRFLPRFATMKPRKRANKAPTRQEQIAAIQRAFENNPGRAMEALKQTLTKDAEESLTQVRKQVAALQAPAFAG